MGINDNGAGGADASIEDLEKDIALPEGIDDDPANMDPEKVKEVIQTAKTALAQKAHWRNKAIDPTTGKPYRDLVAEARVVTPPAKTAEGGNEADARIKRLEQSEEKRTFGHSHGLSPDEVDHVFANANGLGIKPQEALEKPAVKAGIEAIRRIGRVDSATPGSSSRSPVVEGKHYNDMSMEDRKKNFPGVVGALQRK